MPVRILYIHHRAVIGGAETTLCELIAALDRSRFEPVAALGEDGPLARKLDALRVPIRIVPMARPQNPGVSPTRWLSLAENMYHASSRIAAIAVQDRVSLIHANTFYAMLQTIASAPLRHLPVPRVWTARDFISKPALSRAVTFLSSKVIAISKAVENFLEAEGIPKSKIRRIYNGVDVERFRFTDAEERREAKRMLGFDSDLPLVISVGQFAAWKRHDLFLKIMESLAFKSECNPRGFSCAVVGGSLNAGQNAQSSIIEKYKKKFKKMNVNFSAPGIVENIELWHRAADVLVSASENEPFGRVLAEAFASGTAVVTTDGGAKPEIVENEKNGLVVPCGAAGALKQAIQRLMDDEGLRNKFAAAGRSAAETVFNSRRMAEETMETYADALKNE